MGELSFRTVEFSVYGIEFRLFCVCIIFADIDSGKGFAFGSWNLFYDVSFAIFKRV